MKKIILSILISLPIILNAQDFKRSVGFRGGESTGITFRFFSDENNAAEALLSFRDGGIQFTVLKELYMPVLLKYSDHIFLYKGYGGHIGYSQRTHHDFFEGNNVNWYHLKSAPLLGIDGVMGLEYRLFKYPLTGGIDFKPFAEIGGRRFFRLNLWDFAFTLKYTFK